MRSLGLPNCRSSRPVVEQLETRNVLSSATFAVSSGIVKSPENFTDFVTREYLSLLHRTPDPGGLNHFVTQLESGMSPEFVEAGIVASDEYFGDHGNTNTGWLNGVYQDLLGRAPDSSGLDHWLSKLAGGESTLGVASEITSSSERDAIVIGQDYASFLGRAARPDEVNAWLARFQQGETRASVAAGILASDEFFADANNTPSTFIVHVYQDVLHRTPNSSEVLFWMRVYFPPRG